MGTGRNSADNMFDALLPMSWFVVATVVHKASRASGDIL